VNISKHKYAMELKRREIERIRDSLIAETNRRTALEDYSNDLSDKLNVALERLKMLSVGTYYTIEANYFDSSELRASKTATAGLQKIARMRERKP
jgi:hypothetical protein